MGTKRAELYTALAEALADPPDWLALPGCEWPLVALARELALSSPENRHAIEEMERIPAEPLATRRQRYDALFAGPGRPRFWLYESVHRSGRLFGPQTLEVEAIYRAAGLTPEDAELPDHASLELAFLAHAAAQAALPGDQNHSWQEIELSFIKRHVGLWLPTLGRDMAGCQDEVYAPLGRFLAGWLVEIEQQAPHSRTQPLINWMPKLSDPAACNLCGFCVQVCPRRALAIRENGIETALVSASGACSGCGKCVRICPPHCLRLEKVDPIIVMTPEKAALRSSPRADCPRCGQPTVSQAELEAITARIGHAPWIELCQDCKSHSVEQIR